MTTSDTIAIAAAIIALLSAFISVGALVVSWLAYRRDRGHLKISVEIKGPEGPWRFLHFIVSVVNVGRRPVIIRAINGINKKNETIVEPKTTTTRIILNFPLTLDEGRELLVMLALGNTISDFTGDRIMVDTTNGKFYFRTSKLLSKYKPQSII